MRVWVVHNLEERFYNATAIVKDLEGHQRLFLLRLMLLRLPLGCWDISSLD